MSTLIEAIKFTIRNYSINHANALFNKLQKFSKTLSNFLKTKYPRGQNVDAGKISEQFKEFDCTEEFEHDIIANAQVIFKTKGKNFNHIVKKDKKPKRNKSLINKNIFSMFMNSNISNELEN